MNNDIKEIQERLDYLKAIEIEPEYCEDLITTGELQRLLDYITNLQEKLDFIIDRNDEKQEIIDKAIEYLNDKNNYDEEYGEFIYLL